MEAQPDKQARQEVINKSAKMLVRRILGNVQSETVGAMERLAVNTLQSTCETSSAVVGLDDEGQLSSRISRRLADHAGEMRSVEFAQLWRQLQLKKTINKRYELLRFLTEVRHSERSEKRQALQSTAVSVSNSKLRCRTKKQTVEGGQQFSRASTSCVNDLFVYESSLSNGNGNNFNVVDGSASRPHPVDAAALMRSTSAIGAPRLPVMQFFKKKLSLRLFSMRRPFLPSEDVRTLRMLAISSASTSNLKTFSALANTCEMSAPDDHFLRRNDAQFQAKANSSAACAVSSNDLARDLLYVLQGIEGRYLKWSPCRTKLCFQVELSSSVQALILKVAECGWLFLRVREFCDSFDSNDSSAEVTVQSFSSALRDELTLFYQTLALIQSELAQALQEETAYRCDSTLALRRIFLATFDARERFQHLVCLLDECKGKKGGALVAAVYSFYRLGDPMIRQTMARILELVCQPLHVQIIRWLYDGHLDDTHDEFFIHSDASVEIFSWHKKYAIREEMVPQFFTQGQVEKILVAGKSVNFLRCVCKEQTMESMANRKRASIHCRDVSYLFDVAQSNVVDEMISVAYADASRRVLDVLNTKFNLQTHFGAFKKILLLTQGDFARHLIDLLHLELESQVSAIRLQSLTLGLDAAIQQTNAQFEAPEVIARIGIKPIDSALGQTKGWDAFFLQYDVTGPISTIFTDDSLQLYARLFAFIWKIKRLDFVLCRLWRSQLNIARVVSRHFPELSPLMRIFHGFNYELVHFVQQLQYYLNFEVLESSWRDFQQKLQHATDLDAVVAAHAGFLHTLASRTLLQDSFSLMQKHLRAIFDLIFQLETHYNAFAQRIDEELRSDRLRVPRSRQTTTASVLVSFRSPLKLLQEQYRMTLQQFLNSLADKHDYHMMWLSFRLNFSAFYEVNEET